MLGSCDRESEEIHEREILGSRKKETEREMLFSFEETEERGKREMLAPVERRRKRETVREGSRVSFESERERE
ncbi:Obscurin, partial [Manis pentadactyla]